MDGKHLLWALLASTLVASAGCSATGGGGESTGKTRQPIAGGTLDPNAPPANATVLLTQAATLAELQNPNLTYCSGTLITPRLILTAGHCRFLDSIYDSPPVPVQVFVGPGRSSLGVYDFSPLDQEEIPSGSWPTVTNTWAKSGNDADPCEDIRLVEIDGPILFEAYATGKPAALGEAAALQEYVHCNPVGLPCVGIAPAGPSPTWAMASGYGAEAMFGQSDIPHARKTAPMFPTSGFGRFACMSGPKQEAYGGFYHLRWTVDWNEDFYAGPTHGDSGGPLYTAGGWTSQDGPRSRQIAVTHGGGSTWYCDAGCVIANFFGQNQTEWNVYVTFTDIAAAGNAKWIEQLVSLRGGWLGGLDYLGDCNASKDRDCDHILDFRDNCDSDFNPNQGDSDADGIGDICDNCPFRHNPAQANCNAEIEDLLYPPNTLITAALRWDPATTVAALATNRAQRPGDACDPNPCNRTSGATTKLSAWTWGVPESLVCLAMPECGWRVDTGIVRNPNGPGNAPGTPGSTKLRYCRCDFPHGDATERRAAAGACICPMTDMAVFHDPNGPWRRMHLSQGSSGAVLDRTPQDAFWFSEQPLNIAPENLTWSWLQDLPALTGAQPPPYLPPPGGTEAWVDALKVSGILWSHVESLSAQDLSQENRASHFRALDVKLYQSFTFKLDSSHRKSTLAWPPTPPLRPCLTCGFREPWLFAFEDPDWGPGVLGLLPDDTVPLELSPGVVQELLSLKQNPEMTLVPASDAGYWGLAKGTTLRAAVFDGKLRDVTNVLYAPAEGPVTMIQSPTHWQPFAAMASKCDARRLLALSSGRRTIFDLNDDSGSWRLRLTELPVKDWVESLVTGAVPIAPVAMTYRHEDDALYVLEYAHKHLVRLLRIDRAGHSVVRGQWKVPGLRGDAWLTTDYDGDLLLAASNGGHYKMVKLQLTSTTLTTKSFAFSNTGRLAAGPRGDALGVTAAIWDSKGAPRVVAVEGWKPGEQLPGWKTGPEWCLE